MITLHWLRFIRMNSIHHSNNMVTKVGKIEKEGKKDEKNKILSFLLAFSLLFHSTGIEALATAATEPIPALGRQRQVDF